MPVIADDLRQCITRKHWRTIRFFFKNDLQQNAARQIFFRLRVDDSELFIVEHQLLYISEGNVRTCLSIVKTSIRILFNQALGRFFCTSHRKFQLLRRNASS